MNLDRLFKMTPPSEFLDSSSCSLKLPPKEAQDTRAFAPSPFQTKDHTIRTFQPSFLPFVPSAHFHLPTMNASVVKSTTSACSRRSLPADSSSQSPPPSVLSVVFQQSNRTWSPSDDDDDNNSEGMMGKPLSSLSHHRYFTPSPLSASAMGLFDGSDAFSGGGPTLTTLQALESACDIASQVMDLLGFADSDSDDEDEGSESNYDIQHRCERQ
jgi:hypothetical protein